MNDYSIIRDTFNLTDIANKSFDNLDIYSKIYGSNVVILTKGDYVGLNKCINNKNEYSLKLFSRSNDMRLFNIVSVISMPFYCVYDEKDDFYFVEYGNNLCDIDKIEKNLLLSDYVVIIINEDENMELNNIDDAILTIDI